VGVGVDEARDDGASLQILASVGLRGPTGVTYPNDPFILDHERGITNDAKRAGVALIVGDKFTDPRYED
jgi:hypothetical protein